MNLTARNVLQNKLGIDRGRADWLAEQLSDSEAVTLANPQGAPEIETVRSIAVLCLDRIKSALQLAE